MLLLLDNQHKETAIADAHYKHFSYLIGIDSVLASYHKNEWLFYQTQSWRKEEEELNKSTNRKCKLYLKSDPKKLWTMLDWKGAIKHDDIGPSNIIFIFFKNI